MKRAIIVDIDGTLANCDHRRHFMEQKPKDWKSFYAGISRDVPNQWCLELLDLTGFSDDTYIQVIFVSGRPEEYREETNKWLQRHVGHITYYLEMRPTGDHRKDASVKQEIYEREIKGKYDVLFVVDDRKQCVDMWRAQGLVCLQCAPGEF